MSTAADGRMASLAYLDDFESPWIALRRLDDAIAVVLSWDGAMFPTAWLWFELAGTSDVPWDGRTHLVGLEPNTTPLAYGLAEARRQGVRLLTLEPARPVEAEVQLQVFKPAGTVSGDAIVALR